MAHVISLAQAKYHLISVSGYGGRVRFFLSNVGGLGLKFQQFSTEAQDWLLLTYKREIVEALGDVFDVCEDDCVRYNDALVLGHCCKIREFL